MNSAIGQLISVFVAPKKEEKGPRIRVEAVTSKVAFAYEKLRNAIDYKEDNLIRITAVERILKRRVNATKSTVTIAKSLIDELIRAKYLENDALPETKVNDVAEVINKYVSLRKEALTKHPKLKATHPHIFDWIIEMASREIDEILVDSVKSKALVDAFYQTVFQDMKFEYAVSEKEKKVQLYIACNKSFMKWDQTTIEYLLMRYYYPHWFFKAEEVSGEMAENLPKIYDSIKNVYANPLNEALAKKMKRHVVLFDVMHDLLESESEQAKSLFANPDELSAKIRAYTKKKYASSKKKLRRSVVNAIIYILITKSIFAILIETPIDLALSKEVHTFALLFNILVPPLLMLLFAMRIKVPKDDNTDKIVEYTTNIVQGDENADLIQHIKKPKTYSFFTKLIFWILYFALYVFTFGAITRGLIQYLNFNFVSVAIFIFFLSIVVFFLIRISRTARELSVVKKKENFISLLFSLFILPIVRFGRWLSESLGKINIFIYILDFIIEAPFKKIIEFFEEWLGFLKEKKDEVY